MPQLRSIPELELLIRDSKISTLSFIWKNKSAVILLIKYDSEIKLTFSGLQKLDLVEDFSPEYISHVKCLEDNFNKWICLDPYDEGIKKIEERDNFVLKFKSITIEK